MPVVGSYHEIYRVVCQIPWGKVATYGQIAHLAGRPGQARLVGYALSALSDSAVPWQRVINSRGEVSCRSGGSGMDSLQRLRLEAEGVVFTAAGKISLPMFQWQPGLDTPVGSSG